MEKNDHKNYLSLSKYGIVVDETIKVLEDRYENLLVEGYCIMPNHVHMIIVIQDNSSNTSLLSTPIGFLKMNSAKQIRIYNPAIPGVWQRGFHDRIIRNETEHDVIRKYINTNAQRWKHDVFYIKDEEWIY